MKRRDLLIQIEQLADANGVEWYLHSRGGNHDKYKFNGATVPVPRHKEIGEGLAAKIIKQCKNALPKEDGK